MQAEWNKFNKLLSSQGGSPRQVQEYAQNMINEISRSIDNAAKHQRISNGDASPSSLREEVIMNYRCVAYYNGYTQNVALHSRIRQLESQLSLTSHQGDSSAELQTRCESLIREREAVHTIMEQKIKVLVNSVAQAVGAVLQNSQGGGSAGPALAKVDRIVLCV